MDDPMVTQPAYLKNLKSYARVQYGDARMVDASEADLDRESDRGAIILAATGIEDILEYAIGMKMKPLETDSSARAEIFTNKGPLSTYSDKTLIAYALGIIDKRARKDIDLIREIRNACAHCRQPLNLGVRELADAIKAVLGAPVLDQLINHEPETLRAAFICECAAIGLYIATGRRLSSLDNFAEIMKRGVPRPRET